MRKGLLTLLAVLLPLSAGAVDSAVTQAQRAQVEALRAEIAGQLQLQAYDLVDELVYGWTQRPVFAEPTPVVLAGVSVPVGYGSGLEALIENHFAGVVTKNPRSHVVLAYCPMCTAMVVYSGAKGTVVSRGVDQPEALVKAGGLSGAHHALFLDFEAEGAALVLRARITSLEPALPIVYAKTLTTSTSSAALLRTGERLESAEEARKEYLDALQGRGTLLFPVRVGVRSYAQPRNPSSPLSALPAVWLQVGAEGALSQARAWIGSFSAGVTWTPEVQTGWLVQGRVGRLLTGKVTSLTHPDLYAFVGGSLINLYGPGALVYKTDIPTAQQILASATGIQPQYTFASFELGLELRVKNRIGVGVYVENSPALGDSPQIGNYLDFSFIRFQSFGAEVSFCF